MLIIMPIAPTNKSSIIFDNSFWLSQMNNFVSKEILKKVGLFFSIVHKMLHIIR